MSAVYENSYWYQPPEKNAQMANRKNMQRGLTYSEQMIKSGMSSPVSYDLQGQGGGVVVNASAGTITGDFRWIQAISDTVISDIQSSNIGDAYLLSSGGLSIPAGVGIGGRFSSITLTSGTVIAYYA